MTDVFYLLQQHFFITKGLIIIALTMKQKNTAPISDFKQLFF